MFAIQHADRVLSWLENYPEDERPPKWMWPFEKAIEAHFDQVKADREAERGGGGSDVQNEAIR